MFDSMNSVYSRVVRNRREYGKWFGKFCLFSMLCCMLSFESVEIIVDAFAGASSPAPVVVATPNIAFSTPSGSPVIITNGNQKKIQAIVGQPVTVNITASDPNGYNHFVFVGITQNNQFYYSANTYIYVQGSKVQLGNTKTPLLPSGSTLINPYTTGGYFTHTTFSWTPTQADNNSSVTVSVVASNYYYPTKPVSRIQTFTINTVDAATPSFSMNAEQTLVAGATAQIPVTVIPDSDNDKVLISAEDLPNGAVLGPAAKNAAGQWVAVLTWTPSADQIGRSSITFQAQDVQEPTVVKNEVEFVVQGGATPAFLNSLPTQVNAAQNESLNFQVIVIPDAHTNDVLITATGLPPGAALSKPVLQNGQLYANVAWKPNASLIGSSYHVTFTAEDNVAGSVPVMFSAIFTAASHYSVFNPGITKYSGNENNGPTKGPGIGNQVQGQNPASESH
jgi:hypothetical protein